MNWRMPWPTAASRWRRKATGSRMMMLNVSRARRKMATMRAPPAPIAASKISSSSFISAAPAKPTRSVSSGRKMAPMRASVSIGCSTSSRLSEFHACAKVPTTRSQVRLRACVSWMNQA